MHCPWQFLGPGKILAPLDVDVDEEMAFYVARHKLERVASLRQVQCYTNQLRALTRYSRPPLTIKPFAMPEDLQIRHVKVNDGLLTVKGPHQDVSYIVNLETRVRTPILPAAPTKVPMLVLGLDRGAIGCAGGAFLQFDLHYMRMSSLIKFTV